MWYKIDGVQTSLDLDEAKFRDVLADKLNLPVKSITQVQIDRKSLDARHKRLTFIYALLFEIPYHSYEIESVLTNHPQVQAYEPPPKFVPKKVKKTGVGPVIVGCGPAGLFAGLRLAEAGMKPVIIERGDGLEARIKKVNHFWKSGELDPESNIQYGIGGAGTFSDGKLTTRVKNPDIPELLDLLVAAGAPPEIRYWQYPHIGTDLLREVIGNIQRKICDLGGIFRFRSRLTSFEHKNGSWYALEVNGAGRIEAAEMILATGNSGRDIYRMLYRMNFVLKAKPFAVGVRIEHPQDLIDRAQYGPWAGHRSLGPAEYHLTYKHPSTGRGVYSFCMCPGGKVVGAASDPEGVVANGMSYHARDSEVANAAIIATVTSRDYGEHSPLAGMEYQQQLEAKAFWMGGGNYYAPVQRLGDFVRKEPTLEFTKLSPTYLPGVKSVNLWEVLPNDICRAIADGIQGFGQKLKNYNWPDAVLTGVETRTSAPVRIVRNEDLQAPGYPGIYPCGEGAGYAGGIVSSALDGWRVAEAIIQKYI